MQQGLHRLIRPFGDLCLGADGRAGVVLVGRQSGEAAELPCILEARKASCDGDHVYGDSFPDSVYALQQLPLSAQYRICGDERINLLIRAYAIGSPRGLENTFSSGEIAQLRGNGVLQISVPIDHGSSGGALLNEYGEAIGITSAGFDDSGANLNFAISTDLIKKYNDY